MNRRIKTLASLVARHLLAGYRADSSCSSSEALPLDDLLAWLGLEVATFSAEDYPPGTFGWLEPGEDLIWIRRDLPEAQRRFTLAHELGHALLHRPLTPRMRACLPALVTQLAALVPAPAAEGAALAQSALPAPAEVAGPCSEQDIREELAAALDEESAEELLGPGQSYSPRSQRELAANLFAAELLMPLEPLRARYLAGLAVAQLATLFGVSSSAMLNRLAALLTESSGMEANEQQHQAGPAPAKASPGYDEFQRAAIEAPTPALIIAGPGSGKTSTLIGRALYLMRDLGVAPRHILALTFSRKAAEEMQERLQKAIAEMGAGEARWHTPTVATVSTFHAFCSELLRRYSDLAGLRPDFALLDETEGYLLLRSLDARLPLRHYHHLATPTLYFPEILKAISRAKDELVTPERYRELAEGMRERAASAEEQERAERALEIAAIYALYQEELQRRGDIDFGGLIMLSVQLLTQHPEVLLELQQRYQHILVDEFQDINRASGVLLRLLAGAARRVWVVGDANQAIYGFRGASPANIARFCEDYPGAVVLPLSRNYRSRPDIVRLAEAFRCAHLEGGAAIESAAGAASTQRQNQAVRLAAGGPEVTLAIAEDESAEMAGLVADLQRRLREGHAYSDLVVLCRTRAQARRISQALAAAGLPVIESGGTLEQEHCKDLLAIVLLLAGNEGMGLLRAARLPEHPLTQGDLEALLHAAQQQPVPLMQLIRRGELPPEISAAGKSSLVRLSQILQNLEAAPDIWSLLAQYLFGETAMLRALLQREDAQARARLLDYAALLQLARRYDQLQQRLRQRAEASDASPTTKPAEGIRALAQGFLDYLRVLLTLRQDGGSRQQGVEESAGGATDVIRVMTVHASKGLEFPVVYLPGLLQQRFPAPRRYSPIVLPEGMLTLEADEAAIHASGEACLFYVGITRARDHLVLSYSRRLGKRAARPSLFLEPLLAALPPERLHRQEWTLLAEEGGGSAEGPQPAKPPTLLGFSQPQAAFIEQRQAETLSAAAIETYQQCPRKYLYAYIYRLQPSQEAYALFVQATRKTIEALHQQIAAKERGQQPEAVLPTREELRALYTRYWQELGGHELPFAPLYEQHGHEVIEQIRSRLQADDSPGSWQPGRSFTVEVAGQRIRVDVDRVEQSQQSERPVRFVRTRFGRRKHEPEPDTRELLYLQAYRAHYPEREPELHAANLTTGETSAIKLGERREQHLYAKLRESLEQLQRHHYPAAPADAARCPTCPFFLICPA